MMCMHGLHEGGCWLLHDDVVLTGHLFIVLLLFPWMDGLLGWSIDSLHYGVESLAFALSCMKRGNGDALET